VDKLRTARLVVYKRNARLEAETTFIPFSPIVTTEQKADFARQCHELDWFHISYDLQRMNRKDLIREAVLSQTEYRM
jgi:hypothetical protein